MKSIIVLIFAATLDYLIGDPENWIHPVQVIGWLISYLTKFALKISCDRPIIQRLLGIILGIIVIAGSGIISWLLIETAASIHLLLGITLEIILLASCFALKSLRVACDDVVQSLIIENISQARSNLSKYVGRDTENLSESEILRAVLETVTENATDGVMAPLFYAIVGSFIPFIGPVPLAVAYKASSTLDSMVGYREAPYTYLGWFSARLEDCLTWVPCRLNVITLALLYPLPGYVRQTPCVLRLPQPKQLWQMCCQDAVKDPSPNSGWSECAYAAILGVQMGGTNWYSGVAKHKPFLGKPINPIAPNSLNKALQIARFCFLLWLGGATSLLFFVQNR